MSARHRLELRGMTCEQCAKEQGLGRECLTLPLDAVPRAAQIFRRDISKLSCCAA